ncbi:MAG: menaquinone biosynthesis protein [Planctomycetales bacterium]
MTSGLDRPLRVGAVRYLNSKPLIEGLSEAAPGARLVLDYPSRLADALGRGELDVALVPSIVCLLEADHEIVSDACVAARGSVMSVKLYSRVSPGAIRTLALDEGSRTSAALARILLAERFGVHPQLEPLPMRRSTRDTSADAVLLIGDRAMHPPAEAFHTTWDLGEEWLAWTGLPFVFAMWAARPSLESSLQADECAERRSSPNIRLKPGLQQPEFQTLAAILSAARDRGVANAERIARREAPLLGISERTAIDYLTRNLHYRLGPAERSGLRLFHQLALELGLAPEGVDLVFRDHAAAR